MTGQVPPLPPGYKLEQQSGIPPLPPGYTLESGGAESRPGVPRPQIEMHLSNLAAMLSPTQSVAGPGEASYVAEADPESQSRMRDAALVGAGGAAGVAAAPGAIARTLPPAVAGVKAVGAWARQNPVLAYAIYDQLHRHFGGALKFIKGMPGAPPGTE